MEAGPYFAGVELGGTKSIALLAQGRKVVQQSRILTTTPQETLRAISDQLLAWREEVEFAGLGIASFGPIELAPRAARYGHMLRTPKAGWQDAGIAQALTSGLDCPWKIDTDVNAAALAEYRWGAGVGLDSVCYVTIGTGVGGGLVIEGMPVHGALHPEMGHLRLRRAPGDAFPGACPFHGDCIEGLVSGPALAARMSCDPAEVPDDDERWQAVACDLAELACAVLLVTAAQRILIGGGVGMARASLLPSVRTEAVARLGGYLPFFDDDSAEEIIRAPMLGHEAGPLGAIALGHAAAGELF
jgi:fructokinase